MTDHPLTDEICEDLIFRDNPYGNELQSFMRSAADWQLEQCIEWLKDELSYEACLLSDFKEAMRPQEDN